MTKTPVLALAALLIASAAAAPLSAQDPDSALIRRALQLHRAVPMIDGHNDLPWEIRDRFANSLDRADLSRVFDSLQTDVPRLRSARVGGQFWSLWAPTAEAQRLGPQLILEQIDLVKAMEARFPAVFAPARTAADIVAAHRAGKIASLMGVEGGDYMNSSIPVLRMFYELGARYMTLTWNATLPWADAAADSARHNGLTPFGREVVREMNRLGMMVDLSHVSDSVMAQALGITEAPVIFSHSSARALADHPRNVPDAILRLLPRNGGVVMVNFYCDFIDPAKVSWNRQRRAAIAEWRGQGRDTAAIRVATEQWMTQNPAPPRPGVRVVADHVEHIRDVAGVDHVGYGSDYDGIDCTPEGLEDVSKLPVLTAELLRRGWTSADVQKVIGLNTLRVMRAVEATSRRLRRERPPSDATIQMDSVRVTP